VAFHHVSFPRDLPDTTRIGEVTGHELVQALADLLYAGHRGTTCHRWFGRQADRLVSVEAASWEVARERLVRCFDGKDALAQDPAFADARRHVPRAASLVGAISVSRLERFLADWLKAAGKGPPPVPGKEGPYIGVALANEAERDVVHVWLPSVALAELPSFFDRFLTLRSAAKRK
jgi:hypothetical protein